MIEMILIGWLLAFVFCVGIFGMAVEIFGPEWVDELWDRIQRGRR